MQRPSGGGPCARPFSPLRRCVSRLRLAFAAGGGSIDRRSPPSRSTRTSRRAKAMIEGRDYQGSLPLLQQVVAKDPQNADA